VEPDQFTERLALVRKRFASKLVGRISDTEAALPTLSGAAPDVAETVAVTHRCIHELCGIGPTVGFVATGRAARVMERILLEPCRLKRALTNEEIAGLRAGIDALRNAARADSAAYGLTWDDEFMGAQRRPQ
jgi:hypothetical protein